MIYNNLVVFLGNYLAWILGAVLIFFALYQNRKNFRVAVEALFFAIAATLFIYNRRWGIVFFIAAIAMGAGRVLAHIHWPIDILGGAVIGIVSAAIVWKVMHKFNLTHQRESA